MTAKNKLKRLQEGVVGHSHSEGVAGPHGHSHSDGVSHTHVGDEINISDEEYATLEAIDQKVTEAKIQLANLQIESQKTLAICMSLENEMVEGVKTIANHHGIEPDATKTEERWTVDLTERKFKRVQ